MTGMLEPTDTLCCRHLLAFFAEMVSCAGSSLNALARVGACSSLISLGVEAALRNVTCTTTERLQGVSGDLVQMNYDSEFIAIGKLVWSQLRAKHAVNSGTPPVL